MFATISEPFFSLFPWQRHDMPGASETGRGDKPFLSHCAKMPSLPSTAILSQANTTQRHTSHNKTLLFTQPQCFPHCWLYFHCKHRSRLRPSWRTWDTALILSAFEDTCQTHGGWFRRCFRSVLIFRPWRDGGVAVVSPLQWQQLLLQRGRRWTGGKSCPAVAQTNHSTYYSSRLRGRLCWKMHS